MPESKRNLLKNLAAGPPGYWNSYAQQQLLRGLVSSGPDQPVRGLSQICGAIAGVMYCSLGGCEVKAQGMVELYILTCYSKFSVLKTGNYQHGQNGKI